MIKKYILHPKGSNWFSKCAMIKTTLSLLLLFPLTSMLIGCSLIPREEEVLAPPLKEPPPIAYDYIELKKGMIENKVQVSGYFVSTAQKDISFKNQSGRLKEVYVKEGQPVKKGDLLAELITDNLESQIKQQEMMLEKSHLSYENTKNNGNKDIELLTMKLENLQKQYDGLKGKDDEASQSQANTILAQIKEQEIITRNTRIVYQNNLKISEKDMEISQLQLENLKQTLADSRLLSPMDGVVDYIIDIEEGEMINAYKTVIRVAGVNDLRIEYKGDKSSAFGLGMKVEIKLNGSTCSGKVVATPLQIPDDAESISKELVYIQPEKLLEGVSIGDLAALTLLLEKKENVLVIPKNLLHSDGERKYVNILENDIRKERDVETGMQNSAEVEITNGLKEGEKILKD